MEMLNLEEYIIFDSNGGNPLNEPWQVLTGLGRNNMKRGVRFTKEQRHFFDKSTGKPSSGSAVERIRVLDVDSMRSSVSVSST